MGSRLGFPLAALPERVGMSAWSRSWLLLWFTFGIAIAAPAHAAEPSAEPGAEIAGIIQSARHANLRVPSFTSQKAEVERLYARGAGAPRWLTGALPTSAARALIARLAGADSLGLEPIDYDAAWLAARARALESPRGASSAQMLASFDVGLSVCAVRFVSDLQRGRVTPEAAHARLLLPKRTRSAEMAVDSLREVAWQGPVLDNVQPAFLHYRLLKNALVRYRRLAMDSSLVPLPKVPLALKSGARYAGALRLRHLLEATGDMVRVVPPDSLTQLYTPDLVAGVKRFQRRQGYATDGVIGPRTLARLDRPFVQRVRQIELTLERWRWLPPTLGVAPVIVNIPAFRLYAFKGIADREADMLAMDVVVGGAFGNGTPVFAAAMKYLVFRPYWEVPMSIMRNELRAHAERDPGYLEREDMILVRGAVGHEEILDASSANIAQIGAGVRVRQRPGAKNALGGIKFIMPNAHDIYLHDTPSKGPFANMRRDASHGCIRLSDPVALAGRVLEDQPEWTPGAIRLAMAEGDDRRVDLQQTVPVFIVYATAIARESGEVDFYDDVYGLDRQLDALLLQRRARAN